MKVSWFKQIELSSRCNLACPYCPHATMQRPKLDMSEETFARVLVWLRHFVAFGDQELQGDLSLHGLGESTLHPGFVPLVRRIREVYPGVLILSTNGTKLTMETCAALRELGPVRVDVSLHQPARAVHGVMAAKMTGILGTATSYAATDPMNWAGRVNWYSLPSDEPCPWLETGGAAVCADGRIVTCCLDADGESTIGSVFLGPGLGQGAALESKPWKACKTCHHTRYR